MMFLDCPAFLDDERTAKCGLPAEVRCRFTMRASGRALAGRYQATAVPETHC